MAAFAKKLGVPSSALLLEEESRDTLGNAYFVRRNFLDPNGWHSIRIVTSDFHLSRAAWVFRKVLGAAYDFSFVSAPSGLSNRLLIERALEECRISIFLMEWMQRVIDADEPALDHIIHDEHYGYANAPTMTKEDMNRRLDEIGRINRIDGSVRWVLFGTNPDSAPAIMDTTTTTP